MESSPYFVTRQRLVQAPPGAIFELLADPSKHPLIDGSGTVKRARAEEPQRLSLGAEFGMDMRIGLGYRIQNTVVEFEEARLIAWRHFNGHRWRYELIPAPRGTLVRETWDASRLKRQWPLKVMGFTRSTPVNIERTLDRLADYFDPTTPRPTDPQPPSGPTRPRKAKPRTPKQAAKQAAKNEAQRQARARKAVQADEAAAAHQAAKAERATRAAEVRAARNVARTEKAAQGEQKPVKAAKPAQVAKAAKAVHVEPMPPIGATPRPPASPPRLPSREAIAAAKSGRPLKAAPAAEPQPAAAAAADQPKPKPTGGPATGRPEVPARRMRRAS
ncbi:SRPBCC family protein [Arthrobacter sp. JSM 101049]|uniref:SRPBCC family protein n=1 Tax=Arthrobacter sp. JSM 101049 TaxID=929097 RepID=UPI00356B454B